MITIKQMMMLFQERKASDVWHIEAWKDKNSYFGSVITEDDNSNTVLNAIPAKEEMEVSKQKQERGDKKKYPKNMLKHTEKNYRSQDSWVLFLAGLLRASSLTWVCLVSPTKPTVPRNLSRSN